MGTNEKSPPRARASKAAADGSERSRGDTGSVVDAPLKGVAQESAPGSADPQGASPAVTSRAYVDGKPVAELRALIDGQAGAFITKHGAFVFSRVYVTELGFDLGEGVNRPIAGEMVKRVDLTTDSSRPGLRVSTENYTALVPLQSLKVSWRH